jgi:hypothetical protein
VIDQVARAGVNYKFDFDYGTLVNLPLNGVRIASRLI